MLTTNRASKDADPESGSECRGIWLMGKDLRVMREFYTDVLGLREEWASDHDVCYGMLRLGEERKAPPKSLMDEVLDPLRPMARSSHRIVIQVDDVEAVTAKVEQFASRTARDLFVKRFGGSQALPMRSCCMDPDGHCLEFVERSPREPDSWV